MRKRVHHVVKRPGLSPGDPEVDIPVSEDLVSVPGIPIREKDLTFYAREYPEESQNIEKGADREWAWTQYTDEELEYRKGHERISKPLIEAASISADINPETEPVQGRDVTEDIRNKARTLGFGEVGFTKFDRRYTFASKKNWVKFQHVICLAYEQDYAQTQTIPSLEAEFAHFGTYEIEGEVALALAEFIRTLGYKAQVHSPNDNSGAYIPLFVNAGLGQLGANGQLLSPHFGSRARLMLITTNAQVTYDEKIDYGIHKFCQICQVCVDRCPGRALMKDKVWWRGVEKNKLVYNRCRSVMVKYEGCGVCMKVCPIQRYGMKPVMEHYVETGEILGKGTNNLEGYEIRDKGYFGPGELPNFSKEFWDIPHGSRENWLFEKFQEKVREESTPNPDTTRDFALKLKAVLEEGSSGLSDE